ncbi:MAG: alternative ribosome rescue aminoacyl-tRNA hydrolase ArfB [Planctomycetota bacterium]
MAVPNDPHQPGGPEQGSGSDGGDLRLAPGVRLPAAALRIESTTSQGPGGQNVNKRETRIRLRVMLEDIPIDPRARDRLRRANAHLVTESGELILSESGSRHRGRNLAEAKRRLGELVRRSLVAPKVRRPTRPTKGSIQRRLDAKKQRGRLKDGRRGDGW